MTLIEVRNRLRDLCENAGSIRAWSLDNKVPFSYTAAVIRGDAPPSAGLLKKMGLRKDITFKKITPDYRN